MRDAWEEQKLFGKEGESVKLDDGTEIVMDVAVDMDDESFVPKGNECAYA